MSLHFRDLGLQLPLLNALLELEITVPTAIQQKTIPALLSSSNDFIGLAKTGTGKTAAFCLPLLQLIDVKSNKITTNYEYFTYLIFTSWVIPRLHLRFLHH